MQEVKLWYLKDEFSRSSARRKVRLHTQARAFKSHIYLHSSFRQVATQRQLLSRVNIRIVRFLKNALHFFELKRRERRSVSTLFTFRGRIVAFILHLHTGLRAGRKLRWTSNWRRKFSCWGNWNTSTKHCWTAQNSITIKTRLKQFTTLLKSITTASLMCANFRTLIRF